MTVEARRDSGRQIQEQFKPLVLTTKLRFCAHGPRQKPPNLLRKAYDLNDDRFRPEVTNVGCGTQPDHERIMCKRTHAYKLSAEVSPLRLRPLFRKVGFPTSGFKPFINGAPTTVERDYAVLRIPGPRGVNPNSSFPAWR
jgi:hypothetical protein